MEGEKSDRSSPAILVQQEELKQILTGLPIFQGLESGFPVHILIYMSVSYTFSLTWSCKSCDVQNIVLVTSVLGYYQNPYIVTIFLFISITEN